MANEYLTRTLFWRQFEMRFSFFFSKTNSECNDKYKSVEKESEVIPTVSDSVKNFKGENEKGFPLLDGSMRTQPKIATDVAGGRKSRLQGAVKIKWNQNSIEKSGIEIRPLNSARRGIGQEQTDI